MKKTVIHGESSADSLNQFIENYDKHNPITKLTCFFDNYNFLLTKYQVANVGISMVLENANGDQTHISNLNCGYRGTGPSSTSQLMQHLGVTVEDAEEYKLRQGFEVTFNSNHYKFKEKSSFFQVGNIHKGGFHVSKNEEIDILRRKVYMVNPQRNNFTSLLNCLYEMQPAALEYFVGEHSTLENSMSLNGIQATEANGLGQRSEVNTEYVNLIIRGNLFDLICFVNTREVITTVNAIHLLLLKKPLYIENLRLNSILLIPANCKTNSIISGFKRLLQKDSSVNRHYIINLTEEEQSSWR